MSQWNDRLRAEIVRLKKSLDSHHAGEIPATATIDRQALRPGVTLTAGILQYKEVEIHVEDHEGRSIGTFFLRFDYEGGLVKSYFETNGVRIALTKADAKVAYDALLDPENTDYQVDL